MDYTKVIAAMRMLAATLTTGKTDADLTVVLDFYEIDVKESVWGVYWTRALALYVLHQMQLSIDIEAGETDDIIGGKITKRKEGDLEVDYANNSAGSTDFESLLQKTPYGLQYLALFNLLKAGSACMISQYATGYYGL